MKSFIFKTLFLSACVVFFTACGDDDDSPNPPATPSLAEVVANDDRFTILLDALQRTGLDVTLDGEGEFTVFAPTDSAFVDLLGELGLADLDAVENELGKEGLKNVLLYHVLGAEVRAANVSTGYVTTLAVNGNDNALSAHIEVNGGVVINEKATVTQTNINASNGVAHVIDKVILPLNIYQLVEVNSELRSLETALSLADGDLEAVLSDPSITYTLFAPDNVAFDSLVAATPGATDLADLVSDLGTDVLRNVLLYHVVSGELRAGDLAIGSVTTAASDGMGGNLAFNVNINGTDVSISDLSPNTNDAEVTEADITGTNGVVHTITSVLLPQ